MTRPVLTVVPEALTEDNEVVHIWCTSCDSRDPMISVCGVDLTGHDKVPGHDCPYCIDLWPSHKKELHGA